MLRGVLSSSVAVSAAVALAQLWCLSEAAAQPADRPAPAAPATPAAKPPPPPPPVTSGTELYTVVAGDSCRSIALRVIGSAQTINDLHRLNPQLGPTPHALVAGQKLLIPERAPTQADAQLTARRGDVEYRSDKQTTWDAARLGMDLFRAWRVGARARASAEVTFVDASQLRLRENTVVIIYGPAAPRAPATAVRAEIEGGSLEARLAAASAPGSPGSLQVLTPSALAVLRVGRSLFSVDPKGTSLVANHDGEPVAVRAVTRKQPRGAPVRVASGMGSRVEAGKLPEPPRPLPPPPSFGRRELVLATFAATSTVPLSWAPAAGAVRYRAVVLDAQGAEQNAVLLPPGETSFELAAVPPGALRVQISSIDATGFEGIAAGLDVRVVAVAMTPPGASPASPAAPAAPATPATPATPAAPAAPLRVALGARLAVPAGLRCSLEPERAPSTPAPATPAPAAPAAPAASELLARQPGRHRVRCAAAEAEAEAGAATAPAAPPTADPASSLVDIVAVTAAPLDAIGALPREQLTVRSFAVTSEGALGPSLTARGSAGLAVETVGWDGKTLTVALTPTAAAAATETLTLATADLELVTLPLAIAAPPVAARRPPRWSLELGGFAGLLLPPGGSEVGHPGAVRDELASGPLLGVRLAVRATRRPWLAGRLELGAAALSQRGTPDTAAFLVPQVALAVRPLARGPFELWAFGGPGLARLASAPASIRTDTALTLDGGAGVLVRSAGLAFRLDATWSLVDPGGAAELWPSIRLGIASTFDR